MPNFLKVLVAIVLAAVAAWLASSRIGESPGGERGPAAIRVPEGYTVEVAAAGGLVSYPMLGTIDDRGRLFLCESSGKTMQTPEMKANPNYQVSLLEDRNGDGVYDHTSVFAGKLTLPAGAVWYRGSLYVAAPPDLVRLRDTDNDGIADEREVIVTGWNLSANAASLHGPILGPDGWLYLTDGRHGYKIRTKEGTLLEGKASRIWRVRPDGTGLERFAGGGFDNPVEVVFTEAGEVIGTMTYFTDPKDGQRDALLHFVEGGVYPKWYDVVSEFQRTGDLMPVMTKFARIAPSGLLRYRSPGDLENNLFSAHFNSHRVQRHKLFRQGATFRTEDEDFLTSADPDFHPTDVMEDADGSLLVVDTGAWFIHGCPLSRVSKPDVRGAVYRIRRKGALRVDDARGVKMKWTAGAAELAGRLTDPRPAVRDRAVEALVESGNAAVPALRAAMSEATVFALARIGTAEARQGVRAALEDARMSVRVAAARMSGMAGDRDAVPRLMEMTRKDEPAARRQAATALGQIGDARAVPALIAASADPDDRFVEHAIIFSLIQLKDAAQLSSALARPSPATLKAALIALDQMEKSPIRREQALPLLAHADADLRKAALWVASRHADWSADLARAIEVRLRDASLGGGEEETLAEAMKTICRDPAAEALIARGLTDPVFEPRRSLLLDAAAGCGGKTFPASWTAGLRNALRHRDSRVRLKAVAVARARNVEELQPDLEALASSAAESDELRLAAWGAVLARTPQPAKAAFDYLSGTLFQAKDATLRMSAAQILGRAEPTDDQLTAIAGRVSDADPLIAPNLLDAFRRSRSVEVGTALVKSLERQTAPLGAVGAARFQELLPKFPEAVQMAAKPLLAKLEQEKQTRLARLSNLSDVLTQPGNVGRGREVFFGAKAACSSCHTIGTEGGHVGPDLTSIGAIRSPQDLLEAIVLPSESFVPGHEVYRVETATEVYSGVLGGRSDTAVTLIAGPNDEIRIPRDKIVKMGYANVSLMPEGFDETLTRQELIDLMVFLKAQTKRVETAARK